MGCPAREERSLLAYQQLAACGGDVLRKLCAVDALQLRDAGKGVVQLGAPNFGPTEKRQPSLTARCKSSEVPENQ